MMTLQQLGYDQYFRRPLPQEYQQYSAVNYDALFEDGSIIQAKLEDGSVTSVKIQSIKFDQIEGGTATLGGSNNKSGILSVRDEQNNEKVLLDKNGITINDGKININSATGSSVIDGNGLTTSNFPSSGRIVQNVGGNTIQTITAETTYTTVTDGTTPCTFTITTPRATKIYISGRVDLFFYQGGTSGYGAMGRLAITLRGNIVNEAFFSADRFDNVVSPTGYGLTAASIPVDYVGILPTGVSIINLQAWKTSSDTTSTELDICSYSFSYFLLGT